MKKILSILGALALCLGMSVPVMASMDAEDVFEPLAWFGDWVDDYELETWDISEDDENGKGLIMEFSSEPEMSPRLGMVYVDQLEEQEDLMLISRQEVENEYSGNDIEACFMYYGQEEVGTVTSLTYEIRCNLTVTVVMMSEDLGYVVIAWGEGFPMRVDASGGEQIPEESSDEPSNALPETDRELIVPPAQMEVISIGPDSNVVQDPLMFVDGELSVNNIESGEDGSLHRSFTGGSDDSSLVDYVEMLASGEYNFEMSDKDIGSFDNFYIAHYAFHYLGTESVGMIEQLADEPVDNVTVWYSIEDGNLRGAVKIGRGLVFEDLGLRRGGQEEDISLPGQSLQSALYRNADGSYETEDGRFHVDLNEAVVYRDGEPYTVSASLTRNPGENREELRIYNFYEDDSILWTQRYDMLTTGDIFSGRKISPGIGEVGYEDFAKDMEDFFWWNFSNQILGVSHEGKYLLFYPDGGNEFDNAVIRVMNWDEDRGEAVIYLCCTFSTEPYEYEALAAVSMETASSGDDGGSGSYSESTSTDSSDSSDWSDSNGRICTVCHGSGERDCSTCGGKGYIEEYVSVPNYSGSTLGSNSGVERRDCPNAFCRNGKVECSTCGGDGWID